MLEALVPKCVPHHTLEPLPITVDIAATSVTSPLTHRWASKEDHRNPRTEAVRHRDDTCQTNPPAPSDGASHGTERTCDRMDLHDHIRVRTNVIREEKSSS